MRQKFLSLAVTAAARGDGDAYLAALKEFHRLLSVYPQFGEPLSDLVHERGQIWIGIVRPLAMRYAIYEEKRLVLAAALPVLLRPDR